MKFLNKLERKLGKYAVRNLTTIIILGYVIGYILLMMGYDYLEPFMFDPEKILSGQVWRIVTWVITPPGDLSIWTLVMLFFYYSIGKDLERTWGDFLYNVYIFAGLFFTMLGSVIVYLILQAMGIPFAGYVSTYYLCLSMFLAFALEYPNVQVLLFFIIPVKVKWLAYIDVGFLLVSFYHNNWVGRTLIITSLLNFIILYLSTRNYKKIAPSELKRKKKYRKQVQAAKNITGHKCAICGATDETNPELQFRYCSKCNGNYEYCNKHLFTHEHVK